MIDQQNFEVNLDDSDTSQGKLVDNLVVFTQKLREIGLPIGTASLMSALDGLRLVGLRDREVVRTTLRAVFITRYEHIVLFEQAFELFWRSHPWLHKFIAQMSPVAIADKSDHKPPPGATRVHNAFHRDRQENLKSSLDITAHLSVSAQEILRHRDFAQMNAAEIALAKSYIKRLNLNNFECNRRRWSKATNGKVDRATTFRKSASAPGKALQLQFRQPQKHLRPIIALVDISGSMADYTRILLHFLHALTASRTVHSSVHSFLFGTRLTSITRALRHKDSDAALATCSTLVSDWSGGTRIGEAISTFNRRWLRRVLSGSPTILLFSDGLERDNLKELDLAMARLHRSSRRLIWLNPLLRFDKFSAEASGIRTILPHVDAFYPIHNLANMEQLINILDKPELRSKRPKDWL